jgi:hypothetical protein
MDKPSSEVVQFAPKQKRGELEPIDQAGHALIGLLKEAADISKDNVQQAMTMAHRLSLELRSAEDRIRELEADVERLESRATRAEQWLGNDAKGVPLDDQRAEICVTAPKIFIRAVRATEMMAVPKRKSHQDDDDSDKRRRQEEALDEALKNTFPASDPVSVVQPMASGHGAGI